MKKYTLMIMAFAVVALLGVGTVSAFGMGMGLTDEERAERDINKNAMVNAIETNNYAEWEGLMQERLAMEEDRINEGAFNAMVEKHTEREEFRAAVDELRESENFSFEAMEDLKEEYGVESMGPRGEGSRQGFGKGQRIGESHGNCPLA